MAGVWPWELGNRVLVFVLNVPHGQIPEGISVHPETPVHSGEIEGRLVDLYKTLSMAA